MAMATAAATVTATDGRQSGATTLESIDARLLKCQTKERREEAGGTGREEAVAVGGAGWQQGEAVSLAAAMVSLVLDVAKGARHSQRAAHAPAADPPAGVLDAGCLGNAGVTAARRPVVLHELVHIVARCEDLWRAHHFLSALPPSAREDNREGLWLSVKRRLRERTMWRLTIRESPQEATKMRS
eukprot:SM000057S18452  [mRNA]  locus=s57:690465:691114:- [translate_table: standard]